MRVPTPHISRMNYRRFCPYSLLHRPGINALIISQCDTRTSLTNVLQCFERTVTGQNDRTDPRDVELSMSAAGLATTTGTATISKTATPGKALFGGVLDACKFSIGEWPRQFMELEMDAAAIYCNSGGEELDEEDRTQALQRPFEYIEEKLCEIDAVQCVVEMRDGESYEYLVARFLDGSHLCGCRTLQTLGLPCRHFWAAMLQNKNFGFQIGLLNEHWLSEKARGTPQSDWPECAVVKWIVADRYGGAKGATEVFQGSASGSTGDISWKAFTKGYSRQTLQTVLLDLTEKGPTVQDRQVLHADVSKKLDEAGSIISGSMPPAQARALAESFLQTARKLVQEQQGCGSVFVGLPDTVCLPAKSSNKRKRACVETAAIGAGPKTRGQRS